ncbi:MAG TPA: FAD-dependent oxidoreductase [Candidatus Omnitrophota bacterium]|nr:FAD-dependent oxidoreductase [Candidatus Omnitrophota bacterium]HQL40771.1 FAD-dependent oxidoreductase [Candidatus Omnitrophota bacterium]
MNEYRLKFLERIQRTDTVYSFRFCPCEKIDFVPGQFAQVVFDEQDRNNKKLNKYLSFSCRPGKEYVELTKRFSGSDFSRRLWSLAKGEDVLLKGPMGSCTLDDQHHKVAFLIGGIGITPAISILEHVVFSRLPCDVIMLYSNLLESDIPFRSDLDAWTNHDPSIHVVHTIVDEKPHNNSYRQGMITSEMISCEIPDLKERIFLISGPPAMVSAMNQACRALGCLPENIKSENFVGY